MEKHIEFEDRKNGIILLKEENNKYIVIEKGVLPNDSDYKFENISWRNVEVVDNENNETIQGILIDIENDDYIEDIYSLLVNRKNDDFYEIFINLNKIFEFKKSPSFEDFRGYVGEALFILNIGGRRTENKYDTFDIFDNEGNLIEVKTYSNQKNTITISHEQLIQGAEIFIVPLINDNDGIDIIELSNLIDDHDFGIEIKTKFKDTKYCSYKFKNETPKPLEWIPEVDEKLPKGINSAKYIMSIFKPKDTN